MLLYGRQRHALPAWPATPPCSVTATSSAPQLQSLDDDSGFLSLEHLGLVDLAILHALQGALCHHTMGSLRHSTKTKRRGHVARRTAELTLCCYRWYGDAVSSCRSAGAAKGRDGQNNGEEMDKTMGKSGTMPRPCGFRWGQV